VKKVDRDQNKNGRYYMVKFMWQGRMIRKSTRCTNAKDARTVEGKIRSELGRGNWGVLDSKPRLTLAELLKDHFLHSSKRSSRLSPTAATTMFMGRRTFSRRTSQPYSLTASRGST